MFVALGLLAACGPQSTFESSTDAQTAGSSTDASSGTTLTTTTGDPTGAPTSTGPTTIDTTTTLTTTTDATTTEGTATEGTTTEGTATVSTETTTIPDTDTEWSSTGRPWIVAELAVTAPAAARDDWRCAVATTPAPAALRPRLAAYWTRIGLSEHASIASFARFVLQLLGVGAPPELVLAGQRALADEVEHARLCFALASVYAGTGVGPDAFPAAGEPGAQALDAIVAAVIREACVGETLSALEAREAALRATDPGLRRVLARIADDEQRHAELGWRFVQWALDGASADRRAAAQAAFTAAIEQAESAAVRLAAAAGEPELHAYGVIDPPLRAALWHRGLRTLVRPVAAALDAAA